MTLRWRVADHLTPRVLAEHASVWHAGRTLSSVRHALVEAGRLTATMRDALAVYARIRSAVAARDLAVLRPEAPLGADLLPGQDHAEQRMLADLWRHRPPGDCAVAEWLELSAALAVLDVELATPVDEGGLSAMVAAMAAASDRVGLEGWLQTVHGVAPTETVEVVPVPVPVRATWLNGRCVLPRTPEQLAHPRRLEDALCVVVHELGHAAAARLPAEERTRLCNQQVAAGLRNAAHPNLIDEAIQTALANIAFRRHAWPDRPLPLFVYGLEPETTHPYGIDAVARALQLDPAGSYADWQSAALEAQSRVLPLAPIHLSRVAFVHADTGRALRLFQRLFPGLSRWDLSGDLPTFARLRARGPDVPAWTLWSSARLPDGLVARATVSGPPWHLEVAARNLDGLRQLLVQLHQTPMSALPLTLAEPA